MEGTRLIDFYTTGDNYQYPINYALNFLKETCELNISLRIKFYKKNEQISRKKQINIWREEGEE